MGESSIVIIIGLLLCGALGALTKDLLVDNSLILPKFNKGKLSMGFLGSVIIGALVGYFVDHSPLTAFFAGFTGFSTLAALSPTYNKKSKYETAENIGPATPANPENKIKICKPFLGNPRITQKFGVNPKLYKIYGYAGHFGIDWAINWGEPILACDSGVCCRVGCSIGNGNFIEINHGWGKSLYLHLKEQAIPKLGQMVKRGSIIGYCGNTGHVIPAPTPANKKAGTHLHFSLKINDIKNKPYKDFIDPLPFLEK